MAKRSYKQRPKHDDDHRIPWAPIITIALVAVAFASVWFIAIRTKVETDKQTLCRMGQPPPSITTILIDTTDKLSSGEQQQIRSEIERLRGKVPQFGLIEVFAVTEHADDSREPRIAVCNPGRGADMNDLYQNPKFAERQWEQGFRERLDRTIDTVVATSSGGESPLMEAIRRVSIGSLGRPELDRTPKRLVIFSDFLQNTPTYTQYRRPSQSFEAFRKSAAYSSLQVNLTGVDVLLFYIARPRTAALQDGSHQEFWVDYLTASGSSIESVKRILGD